MTGGSGLRRSLRLVDLVSIGVNSVIGTGIFFLPGEAAARLGPAATLAFLASALLCTLLVLCFADAGGRFDRTGGPLLYAEAAFGPLAGYGVGWMTLAARIATWGALANAFVTAVGTLAPRLGDQRLLLLTLLYAGLAAVNLAGVRSSAGATNLFTLAKVVPMLVFIAVGAFSVDPGAFRPFAPHGYGQLGSGTLLVLFAFVGFETLPIPAGEMKDPRRDIPRALFVSMAIITALYLSIWVVCVGTLPTLAGSAAPVSEAAARFLGPAGRRLIDAGILMSVIGVNLAVSLAASRCLYALGVARQLPAVFGRVHGATGTPAVAIVATSVVGLVVSASGSYVELALVSVVARFAQYIPTALAVLVLRRRLGPGGFRAPGGAAVPVLALGLCCVLLAQAEARQLLWGAGALTLGYLLYGIAARGAPSGGAP